MAKKNINLHTIRENISANRHRTNRVRDTYEMAQRNKFGETNFMPLFLEAEMLGRMRFGSL
ncbi:hypothetical protein [Corynebacterium timonense]|uniref:Uncharacterized protein n=1 Tax=Corynebacterium timonense TaxID=441500 RepID=A0A1H1VCB4_9CORY|nr:hypothetical protein [Corynebacterium timonense]SDS81859.1 hypothetical protein SAMN04488539_2461 [Corynebacterium timonense]